MSLPFPPLALRRLVSPVVDDSYYDNPSGDYILGPLDMGPLAPGQAYERVLDFGCGPGRDARRLLLQQERPKSYVGVDVNRPAIEWCQENLMFDGFRFVHHDVWSPRYGAENSKNRYLPLTPLGSDFTLINANSVFTHLLEDQVEFYLREMCSMLAPTGIIHGGWFFFSKRWFPMMGDSQNTIFISEHDATAAVYYDWDYFRGLLRSLGLRIAAVKWTTVLGFHNVLTLAKSELFPDLDDKIRPPSSVLGFPRSESFYSLPESERPISSSEVWVQQIATDLRAAQAELGRLLAEKKLQDEQIASLTAQRDRSTRQLAAERDNWAQQQAGIRASHEQTVRILSARLEEGSWKALARNGEDMISRLRPGLSRDIHLIGMSGLFDAPWYLGQYPDVREAGVDPLTHYLQSGAAEGRDPNPYFDSDWYLRNNPDVAASGINPLSHYLRHGAIEQRDPSPAFDTKEYLRLHPEVLSAKLNPLVHFLSSRKSH